MTGFDALDDFASAALATLSARQERRALAATRMGPAQKAERDGREMTAFCTNDYLGLAQDPRVKAAAAAAIQTYGAGAGASRLVSGDHPALGALERRIAAWKKTGSALVFGSGYLANIGTIPAVAGEGDLILIDERAHACQIAGAKLSKASVVPFRHNDMQDLARRLDRLRGEARQCLIVTEGVFSMDGDLSPLPALIGLAKAHRAWTMVDDAHGLGVVGGGRGSAAEWGVAPDIQMGTLSKAAGSYGGYIAASAPVVDFLVSKAKSFVFATGLPPACAAAADKALEIMETEPGRCERPLALAKMFCAGTGLPEPASPIVPIVFGEANRALAASQALAREGFLCPAIRPPTVPEGTARLRVTFAADHDPADVTRLAATLRPLLTGAPGTQPRDLR
jgi:8-amino-7-oxononanoate synthase